MSDLAPAPAGPGDLDDVRGLFRDYAADLGVDLGFQGFDAELATLPGRYAPPRGGLWIARDGGRAAGAVGLRPLDRDTVELKRLYVRPPWRGRGLGRRLLQAAVDRAWAGGAARIRLDTLPHMAEAASLYRRAGFIDIPAYYPNPLPDAVYLELRRT